MITIDAPFPLPTTSWEFKAVKDYIGQGILEQLETVQHFDMDELKNLVYVSIISADNNEFDLSEDDKQEIITRYKLGSTWEYTLEPIKDQKKRRILIDFFNEDT